jgi:hypothetical protein
VAGTAASSGVLPSVVWDRTNSILYVCTTTGAAAAAVWTALNASSATPVVTAPQGYLTQSSTETIITSDSSAGAGLYYHPFVGNLIPIYNGSRHIPTTFSALSLSLVASHLANQIYDVFVFSNSGTLTLVTGPAWTTPTAGAGARGTGSSTTELTRLQGYWVNAVAMTGRNGSTTYSIGANLATYVGSIYMDGTNGQLTCHRSWGQSRKWGVWNAYNRQRVTLQMGDSTATWAYSTATVRQSNGAAGNTIALFQGLAESIVDLSFVQPVAYSGGASAGATIGFGIKSTTAFTGHTGRTTNNTVTFMPGMTALHTMAPFLGLNNVNACETGNGTATTTFQGGNEDMIMTASFMA